MYGFYQDGTYSDDQIRRNRLVILVPTVLLMAGGGVLLAFGRYGVGNFAALTVLLLVFSSSMWWAIGSKASGPTKVDPNTVDYFKRLVKAKPKDL